jgi:hypothetical protein
MGKRIERMQAAQRRQNVAHGFPTVVEAVKKNLSAFRGPGRPFSCFVVSHSDMSDS